jgi:hypothetical protein
MFFTKHTGFATLTEILSVYLDSEASKCRVSASNYINHYSIYYDSLVKYTLSNKYFAD